MIATHAARRIRGGSTRRAASERASAGPLPSEWRGARAGVDEAGAPGAGKPGVGAASC